MTKTLEEIDRRTKEIMDDPPVLNFTGFETGDSSKKDFGKTKFSLVPRVAYRALAELYTLGAAKYQVRGWESGMEWSRIMDALERHYNAWVEGQTHDPIDGQHHLIAVAWCAFALFSYELWGRGTDDRPTY